MSTEELLAVPGLQAVAVETEERVCIPPALQAAFAPESTSTSTNRAGESLPKFQQVLDEAKAANLTVQVGYMYRNNPAVQFCIKAVKEGLIGNVFDLDTAMGRYDGQGYRDPHWRVQGRNRLHFGLPSDRYRRLAHGGT